MANAMGGGGTGNDNSKDSAGAVVSPHVAGTRFFESNAHMAASPYEMMGIDVSCAGVGELGGIGADVEGGMDEHQGYGYGDGISPLKNAFL